MNFGCCGDGIKSSFPHPEKPDFYIFTDDVWKEKPMRGDGYLLVAGGRGRVFDPDARPSWKRGGGGGEVGGGVTYPCLVECVGPPNPTDPLKSTLHIRRGDGGVSPHSSHTDSLFLCCLISFVVGRTLVAGWSTIFLLPPLLFFQNNQGKNGDVVEQNNNFSSLMNRQFEFLVSIFFGWKRERASWRARRDFSTKEKEEMGEVDKNHLRMEKKRKRGGALPKERERERRCQRRASLPKCWWPPVAL